MLGDVLAGGGEGEGETDSPGVNVLECKGKVGGRRSAPAPEVVVSGRGGKWAARAVRVAGMSASAWEADGTQRTREEESGHGFVASRVSGCYWS